MNRFDKLQYLLDTCSSDFIKDCNMLQEMVSWMGEDDFSEFFEKICSQWEIKSRRRLTNLVYENDS